MPSVLLLAVYALAVARVTGFITQDALTERLRDGVIGRLDNTPGSLGSYVSYLIGCSWCASIWVSAVAAPLIWFWAESPILLLPALGLALSQIVGMTSEVGR